MLARVGEAGGNGKFAPAAAVEKADAEGVKLRAPTAIDLFAGAGGFSLGAIDAGARIVGALEFNRHAATTYSANIDKANGSKVPLIQESILEVTPTDAKDRWSLNSGSCDIVLGGPPCQGFSTHRFKDAGVDDPRNKLLGRYFEYVEALRPRMFLVENVPGLLWPRHAAYLKAFYENADAADYDLFQPVVLNARDFDVPQSRRRVFILGVDRNRPVDVAWPPQAVNINPDVPEAEREGLPPWRTAAEAFEAAGPEDVNDSHMQHSQALVDLFSKTPLNGGSRKESGRELPCHKGHAGHSDVYGRIDPRKPGPTMTTACINPSKGRFVHPTGHHGITVRQAARLQSFPDSFTFHGGLIASGEQVGNAVPVRLAKALVSHLIAALRAPAKS